jgi:hypothetical protein
LEWTSAIATSTCASCGTAGGRSRSRPCRRRASIAIVADLGKGASFDQAVADIPERYANQNKLDYAALADAAKSGRIEARTDLL